jgi:hypothetical protein
VKCRDCDTSRDKTTLFVGVATSLLHLLSTFVRHPLKTSRCLRADYNFQQQRVTLLAHHALPDLPAGLCGIETFLPARCYIPTYSRQSTHDSSTTTASPFADTNRLSTAPLNSSTTRRKRRTWVDWRLNEMHEVRLECTVSERVVYRIVLQCDCYGRNFNSYTNPEVMSERS